MQRARNSTKPKGRTSSYAFFVQACREEHKKKHPLGKVVFAEFSKKCAEKWKAMTDQEKQKFQGFADRDRKRYDLEMEDYIPPKGATIRRRQKKDPEAPKRSISAFFWFCKEERSKVKAMNPEYGVGEVAKELGRLWNEASPEVKTRCQTLATDDKARYEKEKAVYQNQKEMEAAFAPNDDNDGDDEFEGDEGNEDE